MNIPFLKFIFLPFIGFALILTACEADNPIKPESVIDEESLPWQSAELPRTLAGEWYEGLEKNLIVTTDNVTILKDRPEIYYIISTDELFHIISIESKTNKLYRLILVDRPTNPMYFVLHLRIITETMLEVSWGRSPVLFLEEIVNIRLDEPYRITSYPYWERHRPPKEPAS